MSNEKYNERMTRVMKAVHLEEPDRVPFIPMVGMVYTYGYGIKLLDAMNGDRRTLESYRNFIRDIEPDRLEAPGFMSYEGLEAAQPINMHWPNENDPDAPFQYTDHCFLETEEAWDEFNRDPGTYLLTKYLPSKYKALEGLKLLNLYGLCGPVPMGLASAALPPVKQALLNLIDIGEKFAKSGALRPEFEKIAEEEGMPYKSGFAMNPFDEFGDSLRGLINSTMDLYENPERFAESVDKWGAVTIPAAVAMSKMMGAEVVSVPMHCGVDEFMSPENYDKYYWPPMKKLINAIIDAGMTPFLITEGRYDTRLERLCDVPKGKVIWSFEKVDMKHAKEVLGDTACISGNLPTSLLLPGGKKQAVIDATKKLIDDCASGGGYIMSCSMPLDNVDIDLVRVWKETTFEYGKRK